MNKKVYLCIAALSVGASGVILAGDDVDLQGGSPPIVYASNVENGDTDGSGDLDLTDAIRLVNFLYLGGPHPVTAACESVDAPDSAPSFVPEIANGDLDGDGTINVTDVVLLVNFLYLGGPPPVEITCDSLGT